MKSLTFRLYFAPGFSGLASKAAHQDRNNDNVNNDLIHLTSNSKSKHWCSAPLKTYFHPFLFDHRSPALG